MSDKIRGKFYVASVTEHATGHQSVAIYPIPEGSEQSRSFAEVSEATKREIAIDIPDALQPFKPGDKFYVEFTRADAPAESG